MNNLSCQEIDHHHYQKFISNTPHSAFQELQWLDLVARHYSCEIRLLGCYEKDKLIAVIPLMGRHMGPFQIWGSPLRKIPIPPSTCFCAPSSQWQPALSCLEQWLSTSRLKYIQITLPPGSTLSSRRWKSEQLDNLELKLDPPLGILWSQLSVRAHWCSNPQFLRHHSKMLEDTYGPQGRPPHIYSCFYEDLCRTRNEHHLSVLYATHKGTYVASIWAVRDSTTCYYWDAAATSSGRKLNANHLCCCYLLWAKVECQPPADVAPHSIGTRFRRDSHWWGRQFTPWHRPFQAFHGWRPCVTADSLPLHPSFWSRITRLSFMEPLEEIHQAPVHNQNPYLMSKLDNSRYQPPMPHRYRLPPLVQPNWRPGDLIHFSPQAPEELADQLCKRYGVKHCLLLDRARSGLYLLCKAFGMNGEWIISPLMHRPTTVLLKQSCAGIALADVDEHFCIDPASVENMVGPSSCAILATHLYGKSADMLALRKVADRHGLLLIENAVHMAGGFNIGGKNISSWADATLLSFNVDKPLGAILGGALLTNRDDIWNAVRGKVRETNSIKVPLERIYRAYAAYRLKPLIAYSPLGRRFRSLKDGVLEIESFPTNQYGHYIPKKPHLLQAVIALQCSRREPEVIRRRRENADKLSSLLRSLQGIRLPLRNRSATRTAGD